MRKIGYKERQSRVRESLQEIWEDSGRTADDPGLREAYGSLPRAPIHLVAYPMSKNVNHGGLLRVADAFRVERVDLALGSEGAMDVAGQRGALAAQPHRWIETDEALREARAAGRFLCALTLSERAIPLESIEWRFPLTLVVGEELKGIPEEVERQCDAAVAIPLFGIVTSLNLVAAAAIAVHHATMAYRILDPSFEPARRASRALLGMAPIDYSAADGGA
jgi:tRNA G18 (ribose-2'-O)-methylase SpoU